MQIYPRSFLGSSTMFEQQWWQMLVRVWEVAASNPLLDLGAWGWPLAALLLAVLGSRRWWLPRLRIMARRALLKRKRAFTPKDFRDRDLNV